MGLHDLIKDKYMNGKSNYKLKFKIKKSIQATIKTMFVNGKIIRIY